MTRGRGLRALLLVGVLCTSALVSSARQGGLAPDVTALRIGTPRPGGGYTVQTIPLETYIGRVLAGEAARDSAPAALEALAVAIRTFALANRDRHRADGFDLCDETHCQVVRPATPATERAAAATAGQVLMHGGLVATVFYSASCGGRTEIPSDVWPGADDPPYLPIMDDDACAGGPRWSAELAQEDLLRALKAAGFRGDRLRGVRVASRNRSGRVARLAVDGLTPTEISGQDLRLAVGRTLGWQYIRSAAFELQVLSGAYRFTGHGYGHGVGMCVIGSTNMAARGATAAAILAKYFPGTTIETAGPRMAPVAPTPPSIAAAPKSAPPSPAATNPAATNIVTPRVPTDVLVVLPDDDEGERVSIARAVVQARDDMAQLLGMPSPGRVTLRFHPTTDDYERATGRAWFTAGAVVGDELHLLPLAVLRERGVLDRTIRHELVHLMADSVLAGRPAWVREGAASYFAGERPIPGEPLDRPAPRVEPRTPCPADGELLQPVSVGTLANAYARARSCFARQVVAGKSWRDVK
ncbi:MAG: SpoIID/LytB domain-containing protein [Acidobacteriota bacterium]